MQPPNSAMRAWRRGWQGRVQGSHRTLWTLSVREGGWGVGESGGTVCGRRWTFERVACEHVVGGSAVVSRERVSKSEAEGWTAEGWTADTGVGG